MKQTFIVLIAVLALQSCSEESTNNFEEITENIFEGDVELKSQIEVDDFGANKYTRINGNLTIESEYNLVSIDNLSPLKDLNYISGNLTIAYNDELESLKGLNDLSVVGEELNIGANEKLENISDLSALKTVGGALKLTSNSFGDVSGLENITSITSLYIKGNKNLANLDALSNVTEVKNVLEITNNDVLVDYCGLLSILKNKSTAVKIEENLYIPSDNDLQEDYCSLSLFANRPLLLHLDGKAYNYNDACTETDTSSKPYTIRIKVSVDGEEKSNKVFEDTNDMSIEVEEELFGTEYIIEVIMENYDPNNELRDYGGTGINDMNLVISYDDERILLDEQLEGLALYYCDNGPYKAIFKYIKSEDSFSKDYTWY